MVQEARTICPSSAAQPPVDRVFGCPDSRVRFGGITLHPRAAAHVFGLLENRKQKTFPGSSTNY